MNKKESLRELSALAQEATADNVLLRLKTAKHQTLTDIEKRLVTFNKIVKLFDPVMATFSPRIEAVLEQVAASPVEHSPFLVEFNSKIYLLPFSSKSKRAASFVRWLKECKLPQDLEFRSFIHYDASLNLYSYKHVVVLPPDFWYWLYKLETPSLLVK